MPFRFTYSNKPYSTIDDFELYTFEQVWGSTALGFGGIGGQAMTSARTYVFVPQSCDEKCFVYFTDRFAYAVPYCDELANDIRSEHMASVAQSGKYKRGI